jgi:hypothetical protein
MNNSFVYSWSDHKTSKVYVGVHKGFDNDGYICSSKYMLKEYKERPQDFTRQIIAKGTWKDCITFEKKINEQLIKSIDTTYNRHAFPAIVNDAETRKIIGQKVSIKNKGRIVPPEVGQAISKAKKGIKLSKEHCEALSKSQIGRKDSPERIANRALALKGINKSPKSEETKAKISLKIKALWLDPEYRARLVKAHTFSKD